MDDGPESLIADTDAEELGANTESEAWLLDAGNEDTPEEEADSVGGVTGTSPALEQPSGVDVPMCTVGSAGQV